MVSSFKIPHHKNGSNTWWHFLSKFKWVHSYSFVVDIHLIIIKIAQINLCRQLFRDPRLCDIEEVMAELSYMPTLRNFIRNSITDVVWGSSILQTVQGLLSAGIVRSVKYAWEKLQKGREGRQMQQERMKRSSQHQIDNHNDEDQYHQHFRSQQRKT